MKRLVLAFAVVALAASAVAAQGTGSATRRAGEKPPDGAPKAPPRPPPCATPLDSTPVPESVLDKELKDLAGDSFRLSDFKGRVVVLNLWATWCPPCRREVYDLNEISVDYAARGVEVVGLSIEKPEQDGYKVRTFVQQFGLVYKVGWVDQETTKILTREMVCVPQTFVVAGDGRIVKHLFGFNPSVGASLLREAVERALSANGDMAEAGQK